MDFRLWSNNFSGSITISRSTLKLYTAKAYDLINIPNVVCCRMIIVAPEKPIKSVRNKKYGLLKTRRSVQRVGRRCHNNTTFKAIIAWIIHTFRVDDARPEVLGIVMVVRRFHSHATSRADVVLVVFFVFFRFRNDVFLVAAYLIFAAFAYSAEITDEGSIVIRSVCARKRNTSVYRTTNANMTQ